MDEAFIKTHREVLDITIATLRCKDFVIFHSMNVYTKFRIEKLISNWINKENDAWSDRSEFLQFFLAWGTNWMLFRRIGECELNLVKGQMLHVYMGFRIKKSIFN